MAAYTNKLSGNSVFCNNRQILNYQDKAYTNYEYGNHSILYGYTRFWIYAGLSILPTFACPKNDDRFIVDSSTGNVLQNAPVVLITADKVSMAGGKTSPQNIQYYLYTEHIYWTMLPCKWARTNGDFVW